MGKIGYYDTNYSVGPGWSNIFYNREYDCLDGYVITPHGIVLATSEGDSTHEPYTRLTFVWNDRFIYRIFYKRYSSRGLATKAKQFAREIAWRFV